MKNLSRKFICLVFTLVLLSIFLTPAYAAKDGENLGSKISYVIEQPAIYSAAPGDKLNYVLVVKLPDSPLKVAEFVNSFTVTVRMDKDLKVDYANLKNVNVIPGKIGVVVINPSDAINTVSFIVKDVKSLGNEKEIKLDIMAVVKKGMKGGTFSNSAAYTYESKDGKELSNDQKDLITSTKKENGILRITNEIYDSTKEIKGQTEKNAVVKVFLGDKEIANSVSDNNGNYVIKIQPLEEGTKLKVVSYFNNGGKIADRDLKVVKDVELERQKRILEEKKLEEKRRADELKSGEEKLKRKMSFNLSTLTDYLNMAQNLKVENATEENTLRLEAAIAQARYIKYKSKASTEDYEAAINGIIDSVKALRKPFMVGFNKDTFGPNDKMTRAQAATVIARILNGDNPRGEFSSFKDVDQEMWYSEAVAFMEKTDIIKGYKDGTFRPLNNLTRAEFASIISKLITDKDFSTDSAISFNDVKAEFWAKGQIDLVTAKGFMSGRSKSVFEPNMPITRAEVASVLNKLLGRNFDKVFMDKYAVNPFKDVSRTFWGYYDVLEATSNF